MTKPRKRPALPGTRRPLSVSLSEQSKSDLAAHVAETEAKASEARQRVATRTGAPVGKQPAARTVRRQSAAIAKRIASAEQRAEHLNRHGAWKDADRQTRLAAELGRKRDAALSAEAEAGARASRLDRLAVLIKRSARVGGPLTDWHFEIADRWLAVIGMAESDGVRTAALPDDGDEAAPLAGDEGMLRGVSSKAVHVAGGSVLSRWSTAIPVADVLSGARELPGTFDPKRPKAARGQAPDGGAPLAVTQVRERADQLVDQFIAGVRADGLPDWSAAAAIRVIGGNETVTSAIKALGMYDDKKFRNMAIRAVAVGLSAISESLGVRAER